LPAKLYFAENEDEDEDEDEGRKTEVSLARQLFLTLK
jgi:hypothetical protein